MSDKIIDCAIVGSGPAGFAAAIYLKRAGLDILLYSGDVIGGQLTTTTEVENYPGLGKISGVDLMGGMQKQVEDLGVEFVHANVEAISRTYYGYAIISKGKMVETRTVIIATGASPKYLGLPSEQYHLKNGSGVSACATCDGFFYRGKDVAVVGGGDTAFEEAIYLSKICKKVHLINRSDKFKASQIMVDRAYKTPNIEIHTNAVTNQILGTEFVEGIELHSTKKDEPNQVIKVDGVFIAIGHKPNTNFLTKFKTFLGRKLTEFSVIDDIGKLSFMHFEYEGEQYKYSPRVYEKIFVKENDEWVPTKFDDLSSLKYIFDRIEMIKMDENGYIITDDNFETNWEGVFAAGDVQDTKYRQGITSAGDGCKAAMNVIARLSQQ